MNEQLLFSASLFAVMTCVGWALTRLRRKDGGRLRERLSTHATEPSGVRKAGGTGKITGLFQKIGAAAAKPFMPETREKQGALRKKLGMAGIYAPSAIKMVTGSKVICLGAGLAGGYAAGAALDSLLFGLSIGGLVGYLIPSLWLKRRIKLHQKALDYGLPDALDLMVVCVEAGLGVDAAMQRVGMELAIAHAPLSRELEIAHMETRVGLSRADAMRNLGTRTANASLQSLASMLIQAERFGTSVATALKVHGESLRILRQHKAEEMAAKASVKMSFPLVLFIFPATFIVLAGPTVVQLMNSPLFM